MCCCRCRRRRCWCSVGSGRGTAGLSRKVRDARKIGIIAAGGVCFQPFSLTGSSCILFAHHYLICRLYIVGVSHSIWCALVHPPESASSSPAYPDGNASVDSSIVDIVVFLCCFCCSHSHHFLFPNKNGHARALVPGADIEVLPHGLRRKPRQRGHDRRPHRPAPQRPAAHGGGADYAAEYSGPPGALGRDHRGL